jgi:hypothetical protein
VPLLSKNIDFNAEDFLFEERQSYIVDSQLIFRQFIRQDLKTQIKGNRHFVGTFCWLWINTG